jgi:hypothetical protein
MRVKYSHNNWYNKQGQVINAKDKDGISPLGIASKKGIQKP